MSRDYYMVRLDIDMRQLAYWGASKKLLRRGDDMGYALHAALKATFADYSPQPFRMIEASANEAAYLLGYSDWNKTDIVEQAQSNGLLDPNIFNLRKIGVKAMPTQWGRGARYGFEVRIRPTTVRRSMPMPPVAMSVMYIAIFEKCATGSNRAAAWTIARSRAVGWSMSIGLVSNLNA